MGVGVVKPRHAIAAVAGGVVAALWVAGGEGLTVKVAGALLVLTLAGLVGVAGLARTYWPEALLLVGVLWAIAVPEAILLGGILATPAVVYFIGLLWKRLQNQVRPVHKVT